MRSKKLESEAVAGLRRSFERRGWTTVKTHGGRYQSGLPDLALISPSGLTVWLEAKVHDFPLTVPSSVSRAELESLLGGAPSGRGPTERQRLRGGGSSQWARVASWARRGAAVLVAAYDDRRSRIRASELGTRDDDLAGAWWVLDFGAPVPAEVSLRSNAGVVDEAWSAISSRATRHLA